MDTLKPKNSKSIPFTVRGGFFTFWAILAHSVAVEFLKKRVWAHENVMTEIKLRGSPENFWRFTNFSQVYNKFIQISENSSKFKL